MRIVGMAGQEFSEGTVSGGHAADLSADQIAEKIAAKSRRKIDPAAAKNCAQAILGHPGGNAAGGALNGVQHQGRAIYHHTRNGKLVSQGCSVFFCDMGGGVAKILAIGNHVGTGKSNVYDLDWVSRDFHQWRPGRSITI